MRAMRFGSTSKADAKRTPGWCKVNQGRRGEEGKEEMAGQWHTSISVSWKTLSQPWAAALGGQVLGEVRQL